jgi:thiol-disulfide isomerase/thioredoxin
LPIADIWREYKITIILFLIAVFILIYNIALYAQETRPAGLARGSRVPDVVLAPVLNSSASLLRVSDFSDRLLVIDFWSTSCSTCIADMPAVAELQKKYAGQIKVIYADYEDAARVKTFYKRRPELQALGLPVVVEDVQLKQLFPHRSQPHLAWIDHGVFIAATEDDYFNSRNIDSVLLRGRATLREKVDVAEHDPRKPVFQVSASKGLSTSSPVYSSCFTGHLAGIETSARLVRDSASGSSRFYLVNQAVLNLYTYILRSPLPLTASRRILEVSDTAAYVNIHHEYDDVWDEAHTWSFEATAPWGASREEILAPLKPAMETALGIRGRIEQREIPVLELHQKGKGPAPSRYREKATHLYPGVPSYMRHIDAAFLTDLLNSADNMPFVVNETGLSAAFDLELAGLPRTPAQWNAALKPYGLCLEPAWRKLPVFILSENRAGTNAPASHTDSSNAKSHQP